MLGGIGTQKDRGTPMTPPQWTLVRRDVLSADHQHGIDRLLLISFDVDCGDGGAPMAKDDAGSLQAEFLS